MKAAAPSDPAVVTSYSGLGVDLHHIVTAMKQEVSASPFLHIIPFSTHRLVKMRTTATVLSQSSHNGLPEYTRPSSFRPRSFARCQILLCPILLSLFQTCDRLESAPVRPIFTASQSPKTCNPFDLGDSSSTIVLAARKPPRPLDRPRHFWPWSLDPIAELGACRWRKQDYYVEL